MNSQLLHPEQLIIFTRYPLAGAVKTRLVPKLGRAGAASLHRNLTEHVLSRIHAVTRIRPVEVTLYYTGGSRRQMANWLGDSIPLARQEGEDLGERMYAAFVAARRRSAQRIVLIGSDCPGINDALIADSLEELHSHDLVLGPTLDGGYYLIGLTNRISEPTLKSLFTDIAWGTPNVFAQTIAKAHSAGLANTILQPLTDIDRPQDLGHFRYHPNA